MAVSCLSLYSEVVMMRFCIDRRIFWCVAGEQGGKPASLFSWHPSQTPGITADLQSGQDKGQDWNDLWPPEVMLSPSSKLRGQPCEGIWHHCDITVTSLWPVLSYSVWLSWRRGGPPEHHHTWTETILSPPWWLQWFMVRDQHVLHYFRPTHQASLEFSQITCTAADTGAVNFS